MENRITSTTEIEMLKADMLPSLDELFRQSVQRILATVLEAEVEAYIRRFDFPNGETKLPDMAAPLNNDVKAPVEAAV